MPIANSIGMNWITCNAVIVLTMGLVATVHTNSFAKCYVIVNIESYGFVPYHHEVIKKTRSARTEKRIA